VTRLRADEIAARCGLDLYSLRSALDAEVEQGRAVLDDEGRYALVDSAFDPKTLRALQAIDVEESPAA
jgi:hypothetical protein